MSAAVRRILKKAVDQRLGRTKMPVTMRSCEEETLEENADLFSALIKERLVAFLIPVPALLSANHHKFTPQSGRRFVSGNREDRKFSSLMMYLQVI